MNEQEKEINLKRLLYKALKNWRVAVAAGIIGAVVVGGTRCTVELVKLSDPEVIAARQTEYLGELAVYQQKGTAIEKEIDTIHTSIRQQEEYNQNSVLMEIDPYNEWKGSVDFYIETDWQIMPDMSYQNQNIANQIVRVYSTYITNGELYQYVIERLGTELEIRYLQEVLSAYADAENYLLHFTVRGASEEACRELLTLIEEGMRAKQAEILESVGEYKLLVTNNSVYSQINYELEQLQKDNLQTVEELNTSLAEKQFARLEWERDGLKITLPLIKKSDAVKEGIKTAVLTGAIIVFLIVLFYGLGYLLSKKVQGRDEFTGWGLFVGELPRSYRKRRFCWVDRLLSRWFLGDVKAGEYEARLCAAAKQIGEAAKLSCDTAEPTLTLVGDLPKEELEALASSMQNVKNMTGVRFLAAGNPLLAAEAIEAVLQADAVVLAVKQEYTKKETVYQMKEQLKSLKKPLTAVVLTETDAVL